ncbi:PTS sugar transporter subunit IIB [Peribacillus huizhouensis]|uniref:PTS system cellobiose-specific IIB component n=1 Tax=Peribacillus huizhouensis TaxID=1501239 RepID=A0ABR6CUL7_9BACI|nr:PTS sugar transporter subunit IIB [Peribacillus huizhouensis]MBA9028655.1 PTS system cellobiose-specific IIB component [Peribacillus huizhouensis]
MTTKKILLVCSAGMSTSLLMTRMKKSAQEKGIDADVMALSSNEATKLLAKEKVDVLLIGPQVRFMKSKFEKIVADAHIPVAVIDMKDYGKMDGEKVLATALELITNNEN